MNMGECAAGAVVYSQSYLVMKNFNALIRIAICPFGQPGSLCVMGALSF